MAPPNSKTVAAPDYAAYLTIALYAILVSVNYKKLTMFMVTLSLGVGCLVYAIEMPLSVAAGAAAVILLIMTVTMKGGFNTRTPAADIAKQITLENVILSFPRQLKAMKMSRWRRMRSRRR